MSESGSHQRFPKAVIHKRILEVADRDPDASIDAIADEVSGASPDVVERVLDTYGDPGEEPSVGADPPHAGTAAETNDDSPGPARGADRTAPQAREHREDPAGEEASDDAPPDHAGPETQTADPDLSETDAESVALELEEVSENQRNVLRAIREHPDATQRELAERFDVAPATISRWVNDIPGFEWQERRNFVAHCFGPTETVSDGGRHSEEAPERDHPEVERRLDDLEQGLAALQDRIDALERDGPEGTPAESSSIDPDLFAKIIRACLADDRITEDEEEAIITALR